ncbi:MAG: hypothetical protein R3C14_26670 [Caldilineaceae bacterium]
MQTKARTQHNGVNLRPFAQQFVNRDATGKSAGSTIQDPTALAGPLIGLTFLASFITAMARATAPYPRPDATPAQIQRYFQGEASSARISAAGQLLSSVAVLAFTTTVLKLVEESAEDARGLETVTIAGGGLATAGLATSALCAVALIGEAGEDPEQATSLSRWAFLGGGLVHGVGFGLLVGALGWAGLRTGKLHRRLAQAALASGAAGMLTPLYLLAEPAGWIIPVGRFSGLLISGIAGVQLARRPH